MYIQSLTHAFFLFSYIRAITGGDVFLGGVLVAALTKLTVRGLENNGPTNDATKDMQVCMCVFVYVYRL